MIVDGEHYPPVIQDALDGLLRRGYGVDAALLAGGTEKLSAEGTLELSGVSVTSGGDAPERALGALLDECRPEGVIDLSDEPVVDARRRLRLAAVALAHGVPYEGADFRFTPPDRPRRATKPTVAVVGTGKRTGKTALAGALARTARSNGRSPVIVAMGRGGPPEPEVIAGDRAELGPGDLLELDAAGKHAASDYVEDALLARVTTVGCRRCGGGLAGAVGVSNVSRGVDVANRLAGDLMVLEGSGSALPPVYSDTTVLVVPATVDPEYLCGYFGPYRLLLADLVVVTMAEEPFGSASRVSSLIASIRDVTASVQAPGRPEVNLVRTVFRPAPTRSLSGASVCVATTAPPDAGGLIARYLEDREGCRVVGMTHALSNRDRLREELDHIMKDANVLACEIKAAGVDVATHKAMEAGLEVVYMDNEPIGVNGDDPLGALTEIADLATQRFEASS